MRSACDIARPAMVRRVRRGHSPRQPRHVSNDVCPGQCPFRSVVRDRIELPTFRFSVDLRPSPGLVLLCVGPETPDSQGHLPSQPARACSSRIAIPAATRRAGGPAGAGPHERFRSTNVRRRRAPPSHQYGPAQRQRTLRLRPIILQAAPVTLRPEARLRTATRNIYSASQNRAENADSVRGRLPRSSPLSARRSCSSAFSGSGATAGSQRHKTGHPRFRLQRAFLYL